VSQRERQRKAQLLGLGLDSNDGHARYTKGKNFVLLGGSQDTHEQMQETAIKINEKLKDRNKELHQVSPQEFGDIADEVGLKPFPRPK